MKSYIAIASFFLVAGTGLSTAAHAGDAFVPKHAGQWIIDTRLTVVAPDEKGQILTSAGASTGLHVAVSNSTVPTLGFHYFLTDHIAIEAILGTSKHTIKAVGPSTDVEVHDTWVVPPVITAQYHFNPAGKVSPYVGAGLNYMEWYSGKDKNGFTVKLKSGAGTAIQAGVDIALKDHLALNFDCKKVFYKTDARINGGALLSKVTLNPIVASAGLSYRF